MHPGIKLMTDQGWSLTMIEDYVTMLQKDGVTLLISNLADPEFPYTIETGGEIVAKFRDAGRAALFAAAEHTCKTEADKALNAPTKH